MQDNLQSIKQKIDNHSAIKFLIKKNNLIADINENLIIVDDEITTLKNTLLDTQQNLDKSKTHSLQLKDMVAETTHKLKETTSKRNELQNYLAKLKPYAQKLKVKNEDLDSQLKDTQAQLQNNKEILNETQQNLEASESQSTQLEETIGKIENQLTETVTKRDELQKSLLTLESYAEELKIKNEGLEKQLSDTHNQLQDNQKTLNETQQNVDKFKLSIRKLKGENEDLEEAVDDTEYQLKKIKRSLDEEMEKCTRIQDTSSNQNNYYEQKIKKCNQEIDSLEFRRTMVGALVSSENTCPNFKDFSKILHENFIEFTSESSSLAEEAKVFLELQAIEQELKLISAFPIFHKKRTIAVGGGFSAGKSEFISSLFKDDSLKLPSDIDATTAIPTYVLGCGDKEEIINNLIGVNKQGGTVNLSKINLNIHKELTHQFMKSFSFPLRKVMPYMFLPTPLAYDNLCFIDTPGYNPAGQSGSSTAADANVAKDYLSNAEALIWLIGADANGTITQKDIEFLKDIKDTELTDTPLYVIYNKADLKSDKDIASVIAGIKVIIEERGFKYVGISAYSSVRKKEYLYEKESLFEFIEGLDKPSEKQNLIIEKIYVIDAMYQYAIKKEIKETKMFAQSLYDVAYKLQIDNYQKGDDRIYDCLDNIEARFSKKVKELEKHLSNLEHVIMQLISKVEDIFGCKSTVLRPKMSMESIIVELLPAIEFEDNDKREKNKYDEPDDTEDDDSENTETVIEIAEQPSFNNLFGIFTRN